ncbi:hypothetical protein [Kineococcus rhizosphaerae]|uniref:Uncharacterized protein n=1 Tax=Kineococcus rhizosphaerae TaxID=559628 RepID=A0A2T0R0P6_9ACTN|nr:hypothetical protein [Kineococcus rhizosphaerae]PRY12882.1 hypothetical protein CLV37_10967 [Kineococcus rhizosphaerae]
MKFDGPSSAPSTTGFRKRRPVRPEPEPEPEPARARVATPPDDLALERWWWEAPADQRSLALSLPAENPLPEDLVVPLLLHGVLVQDAQRRAGPVPQPAHLRRFLDEVRRMQDGGEGPVSPARVP